MNIQPNVGWQAVVPWLVGGIGVPLINYLKGKFNLSGKPAMFLTAAVSVVLALAAMFLSNDLSFADFSFELAAATFGQVLAAATMVYKLLVE